MNETVGAILRDRPEEGNHTGLPLPNATRARAVIIICAGAALAFGAFAVLGSGQWVVAGLIVLVFAVAALTLPLPLVALTLAALVPLQFYFPVAGSLNLRGALVFVAVAALRVLVSALVRPFGFAQGTARLRPFLWLLPAALFLLAAFVAALDAPNRYDALKGIYDWLPIFAAAFVASAIAATDRVRRQIVFLLIAAGVGEALLGLAEYALGLNRVMDGLRLPVSDVFFQPNLLRARLSDVSFNWILDGRVVPFGTFINGIDYAVFLAAILTLVLALALGREERPQAERHLPFAIRYLQPIALLAGATLMGSALLLTFKGSGLIALGGGVGALALLYLPRLSRRTLALGGIVLALAALLALPFAAAIVQRGAFLIQREAGELTATGRTAIWARLLAFLPPRPWFGYGLHNAVSLVEPLPSLSGGAFAFNTPTAESAYVAALIETGVVGFSALMLFLIGVLARAYRRARSAAAPALDLGILAAVVAVLFGNLTVAGFTTDQNGLLLGILIGLIFSPAHEPA